MTAQPSGLADPHALLEHLPDAVFSIDAQGRLTFVNARAARLFGARPLGELVGQSWWTLWPGLIGSPLQEAVQAAVQPVQPGASGQGEVQGPDGSRFGVQLFPLAGGLGVQLREVAPAQRPPAGPASPVSWGRQTLPSGAEVLAALGDALQNAGTPDEVAELALAQLGPALGARSMLVVRLAHDASGGRSAEIRLPTLWGDTPDAVLSHMTRPGLTLAELPMLRQVAQAARGLYLADYRREPGAVETFPALACAVEPIQTPDGTLEGFLVAWRAPSPDGWLGGERELLRRAAGTLGLALERASALSALGARSLQIEEDARAQTAFMAFTEAVGTETDVLQLAHQAINVLRAHFPSGSFSYYERGGDGQGGQNWRARAWSSDVGEQMIQTIQAGFPGHIPIFAEALSTRQPVFRDAWNFEREGLRPNDEYSTLATCPLVVGGAVTGMLGLALRGAGQWRERDRTLVRAVGRGLTLALERAEVAARLEEQNRELAARTQALESFAALTRDLAVQSDPWAFVRRAQEVTLSLLPPGYALYYERDGEHWRSRVQVGEVGHPELQAFIDAGPLVGQLPTLDLPWGTRRPLYQDTYQKGLDTPPGMVEHVNTVASLPVLARGGPVGVLVAVLFAAHSWSPTDRAMLETVVGSLELSLERAEQARQLEDQNRQLEEQNLELQARTRALESFAQLGRELGVQDDRYALVQRAQEVVLSLLPDGSAGYFEPDPEGVRWALRAQVGQNSNPDLQRLLGAGLDWERTQNLLRPWRSGQPLYQDAYDPGNSGPSTYDHSTDGVRGASWPGGAGATATLPLLQHGTPIGIFAIALSGGRRWTKADQAVLGGVLQSLGLALERASATRELNRSQHYLKVVADHAPLLLFATDARGIFTLSEGRLLGDLGLRPGEAVGRSATEMFSHEPDLQAGLRLKRALAGEAVQGLTRFGTLGLVYETWFTPIRNAAGEVSEVVGVSLDVTERLEAQRGLERSNRELERSNRELERNTDELRVANEGLDAFSSSVSHDLRTPVRHVKGFSELARRALNEAAGDPAALILATEKAHGHMLVVEQAAVRMSSLIDAMLNLSRTASQPLRLGPVDLNTLLERARADAEQDLLGRAVEWGLGPLPTVMGDHDTLQQVLINLLSNAAKYSRTREQARIEVWAEERPGEWEVFVRDNGVGFDPVYKDKLFGVFQRLHSEREFEGTGVGLATVRRVVLRHGGQVFADGAPGQGATFGFTLPRHDRAT